MNECIDARGEMINLGGNDVMVLWYITDVYERFFSICHIIEKEHILQDSDDERK
jgi:hypothetical protein